MVTGHKIQDMLNKMTVVVGTLFRFDQHTTMEEASEFSQVCNCAS